MLSAERATKNDGIQFKKNHSIEMHTVELLSKIIKTASIKVRKNQNGMELRTSYL